jgi:hypothetical protein
MNALSGHNWLALYLLLFAQVKAGAATEGIEFVAEHLPEALMDNRIASLPIWDWQAPDTGEWQRRVALGFSRTTAGSIKLTGPLASVAVKRSIDPHWSWTAFAFADRATFRSGEERRALRPRFATSIPLALPADAVLTNLDGTVHDLGAGFVLARARDSNRLGAHRLLAGLLWQRAQLQGYALDYRIVSGDSFGVAGTLDYSATYSYLTPIGGIELSRTFGRWGVAPHLLAALPLLPRGLRGRIRGPGFEIGGTTDEVGNGKHVGEPFLGFGLVLTYRPLGLIVDLGSSLSQALVEKLTHKGLDQNLVVSIEYQF